MTILDDCVRVEASTHGEDLVAERVGVEHAIHREVPRHEDLRQHDEIVRAQIAQDDEQGSARCPSHSSAFTSRSPSTTTASGPTSNRATFAFPSIHRTFFSWPTHVLRSLATSGPFFAEIRVHAAFADIS